MVHSESGLQLFAILIEEHFQFVPDWHRKDAAVVGLVQTYEFVFRSILEARPDLQRCAKRCSHCDIRFFCDPRNVWRPSQRCFFGCERAYRRQEAIRRSVAYNRSEVGKGKKRDYNQRRQSKPPSPDGTITPEPSPLIQPTPAAGPPIQPPAASPALSPSRPAPATVSPPLPPASPDPAPAHSVPGDDTGGFSPALISQLRRVVGWIERRPISPEEVVEALQRFLRQHSMVRRRWIDKMVDDFHEHPP